MSIIIPANSAVGGGFEVANSLRFNRPSSDYLNRTQSGGSATTKITFSTWIKRTNLGIESWMFDAVNSSNQSDGLRFLTNDTIMFLLSDTYTLTTNRVFRDTSAWYHLVVVMDTTQGTDSNRVKLYVNGVQETSFSATSYPSQNATAAGLFVSGRPLYVGRQSGGNYLDGYLAETVFIDNQALAPTSFGEFDSDSGVWKPIDVSGLTFGTNGAYLDFEDSSALGNDAAGSNNFTVNNLAAIDQSTDTCTNNFNVMNLADNIAESTFSEGSLKITTSSGNRALNTSSIGVISGKWYWEVKNLSPDGAANDEAFVFGAITKSPNTSGYDGSFAMTAGFGLRGNGKIWNGSGETAGWNSFTTNDIVSIAIDFDNGKAYFATNGSYGNSSNPSTGSNGYSFTVGSEFYRMAVNCMESGKSGVFEINFGGTQTFSISSGNTDGNGYGNFEYAVPSGYYSLNTKNLAEFG
jgi:hypothetical protein